MKRLANTNNSTLSNNFVTKCHSWVITCLESGKLSPRSWFGSAHFPCLCESLTLVIFCRNASVFIDNKTQRPEEKKEPELVHLGVKCGGRGVQFQVNKSEKVWGSPCDLWLTNVIVGSGHIGTSCKQTDRHKWKANPLANYLMLWMLNFIRLSETCSLVFV